MKFLLFLSDLMIPLIIFYIVGFGLLMKSNVYQDFVDGAKSGLKTVVQILPTLIGLMTGVGILRASGFLDMLSDILGSVTDRLGFPSQLVPLSLVKMFSSSAATSLLLDVYKQFGNDLLHHECVFCSRQDHPDTIYAGRSSAGYSGWDHSQHDSGKSDAVT